jgi:AraC-like DNA-binding protein
MGFSAISQTEVPDDTVVFTMIHETPPGATTWCGVELEAGQLNVYGPGTDFLGVNPGGLAASFLVVEADAISDIAEAMGVRAVLPRMVDPLPARPAVEQLKRALWQASRSPGLLDDDEAMHGVVETAVLALTETGLLIDDLGRRLDSKKIVLDCLEYVDENDRRIPSMQELCRASCASESRVRHAFVEVLDAAPTQYFQYRLLSRLRDELIQADPQRETVTRIASSLGVTQLGRIAGRYRRLFGELPSETLRR